LRFNLRMRVWHGCFRFVIFLIFAFFVSSCGIEDYFYLPQVPQPKRIFNTEAEIYLPKISSEYIYFENYAIFYKIYVSANNNATIEDPPEYVSSEYRSDYNAINPYTYPSNTLANTSIEQLLRSRNFHELSFMGRDNLSMMPEGDTLMIVFPAVSGDLPYAALKSSPANEVSLMRSVSSPVPNQYFLNSNELRIDARNTDVAKNANGLYAYVSMYIVAVGYDSLSSSPTFTYIFSKPAHINLFILSE